MGRSTTACSLSFEARPAPSKYEELGHGRSRRKSRLPGDHGFILVTFGLVIVPLMVFLALAVDVSAWYTRASQLQKAADAASLAGVVYLPDQPGEANSVALNTLAKNDLNVGGNIHATVTVLSGHRLKVTLTDSRAPVFFSSVFRAGAQSITRSAVAQYLEPIPIGSPTPNLGGDCTKYSNGVIPSDACPAFWVNIHGPFSDTGKGDAHASACSGSDNCGADLNSTVPNPSYNRGEGYWYKIAIPQGYTGGALSIRVFDAGYYPHSNEAEKTGDHGYGTNDTSANSNFYTNFRMVGYGPDAYDPNPNPTLGPSDCGGTNTGNRPNSGAWSLDRLQSQSNANYFQDKWASLCTIPSPIAGKTYYVHTTSSPIGGASSGAGANRFALLAVPTYSGGPRTQVSGLYSISIYNNVAGGSSGTSCPSSVGGGVACANFYLAKIDPSYAGKTVMIRMWDTGDLSGTGDGTMYLRSAKDATGMESGNHGGTPKCRMSKEDVHFNSTPLHSGNSVNCSEKTYSSGSRYNAQWLVWQVSLDEDYTCDPTSDYGCWWSVTYVIDKGVTANDTTTWEVALDGKPVHLVE